MPLLDVSDLRAYLRIEHDVDDGLLARLLASAEAAIAAHLGRPPGAEEQTFVLDAADVMSRGLARDGSRARATLRIPMTPVAPDPAPVVTDGDGRVLTVGTDPAADLRLDSATGVLTSITGTALTRHPYTVTAVVGLGARRDYGTVVVPALAQAVCDLVADWYQRRSPAAAAEGAGGGVYTQYAQGQLGIPARVLEQLAPFRRVTL